MLRVEVQNFQSVLNAALDIEGYVALVGKSNIGKSAIVRALQCALTGAVGTDFVRHGQACDRRLRQTKKCKCFCKVTIETSAMKVVWEKGDAVNRYTVTRDGVPEAYEGLERGTPSFFDGAFSLVTVGDEKELIQVPDQFDPIFLLNQTGSVVANVMSDVARLDEVNAALTAVNKDRKDASSKRKVREEDVVRLQAELAVYAGLDEVAAEALAESQANLEAVQGLLVRLERYLELARGFKEVLLALKAALTPKLPVIEPLDAAAKQLDVVADYVDTLQALTPSIEALVSAVSGKLPDLEPLLRKQVQAAEADGFMDRLSNLAPSLKRLKGVDAVKLPDDSGLAGAYEACVRAERFLGRLEVVQAALGRWEGFSELPELDLEGLQQKQASLASLEALLVKSEGLTLMVSDLTKQLKVSDAEKLKLQEELQGMGLCPTCSQDIDANHCLHLEAS